MVVNICDDSGKNDIVVFTREKGPGKFVRQKVLKFLKDKVGLSNDDIKNMNKGKLNECWGDDQW